MHMYLEDISIRDGQIQQNGSIGSHTKVSSCHNGLQGTLSPSENKGTLAGRGQCTRQLNGLASIGTPSLVTRCVVQMI